ncbi:hypothetical protein MBLNU457_3537t2 [Dothideomycetes sp. NU457]
MSNKESDSGSEEPGRKQLIKFARSGRATGGFFDSLLNPKLEPFHLNDDFRQHDQFFRTYSFDPAIDENPDYERYPDIVRDGRRFTIVPTDVNNRMYEKMRNKQFRDMRNKPEMRHADTKAAAVMVSPVRQDHVAQNLYNVQLKIKFPEHGKSDANTYIISLANITDYNLPRRGQGDAAKIGQISFRKLWSKIQRRRQFPRPEDYARGSFQPWLRFGSNGTIHARNIHNDTTLQSTVRGLRERQNTQSNEWVMFVEARDPIAKWRA